MNIIIDFEIKKVEIPHEKILEIEELKNMNLLIEANEKEKESNHLK